jgi:serine/threonine-protein kinase RsbT
MMKAVDKLEDSFMLKGGEFADAGVASRDLRGTLTKLGACQEVITRAAICAFEAEMNVIIHSVAGTLQYVIKSGEIIITVIDMGPGIEDIGLAMQEGYSTAPEWAKEMGWGSGLGLPNIKKNSDNLRIDSVMGEGTTIEIIIRTGSALDLDALRGDRK